MRLKLICVFCDTVKCMHNQTWISFETLTSVGLAQVRLNQCFTAQVLKVCRSPTACLRLRATALHRIRMLEAYAAFHFMQPYV